MTSEPKTFELEVQGSISKYQNNVTNEAISETFKSYFYE